ncbi:unnamed protein product [Owenia fusiformis]|uniref:ubiquitinyl hydrolase 1 n=1 Tax=Owenia fusiformis TaxID=6347 RepID=A0A8J1Y6H2_OWEFU|nr:unnamed protein product [Owenia fusiformis]
MCDVCCDLLALLQAHDERVDRGEGHELSKEEAMVVITYTNIWSQRQCLCCFKDFKNFEKFNNIVQVLLNLAICFIRTLPQDCHKQLEKEKLQEENSKNSDATKTEDIKPSDNKAPKDIDDEKISVDVVNDSDDENMDESEKTEIEEWSIDDKDKLMQFVAKVFLMNFPLYMAYKHGIGNSLEELPQQEATALQSYCEVTDPEIPVFLLRNVCFFCDRNGVHLAMGQCFDKATPDTLPYTLAHTLITIIANLRLWMNIPTVMQYIVPLRSHVIRYMCKLSDRDLRMAGTRNMTDLMWAAVKEPVETTLAYDREGLDLAFKYFTCSTLTIRLAGLAQINTQINIYNEFLNNDSMTEAEHIGAQLANWLIENKIIEHMFGPNLHVELIKQAQPILNFLAIEQKITNEHIDCLWAAGQLKHCSKQVHDVMIPLIKSLEVQPVQHLLELVSSLEPIAHTEQTLFLASALTKFLWNMMTQSGSHVTAVPHHCHNHSFTALDKDHEDITKVGLADLKRHNVSSSGEASGSEDEAHRRPRSRRGQGHSEREISEHHQRLLRQKIHQKSKQKHRCHDSDNSSVIAHSDLSNISDDSLPTDMSENEHMCGRGVRKGSAHFIDVNDIEDEEEDQGMSTESEGDEEDDEEEEESESCEEISIDEEEQQILLEQAQHRRHQQMLHRLRMKEMRQQGHVHVHDDDEDEDEEEDSDEEDYETDEEEEVMKRMMRHRRQMEEDSEDSEEFDEEDLCEEELDVYQQELLLQQHCPPLRVVTHNSPKNKSPIKSPQKSTIKATPPKSPGKALSKSPEKKFEKTDKTKPISPKKTGDQIRKIQQSKVKSSDSKKSSPVKSPQKSPLKSPKKTTPVKCDKPKPDNVSAQEKQMEKSEPKMKPQIDEQKKENDHSKAEKCKEVEQVDMKGGQDEGNMEVEVTDLTNFQPTTEQDSEKWGFLIEKSEEEGSNSSRMSAKSDKNMADFEGEEGLSDEEIAHLTSHAVPTCSTPSRQRQPAHAMGSDFHKQLVQGSRKVNESESTSSNPNSSHMLEDVSDRGNTLLWDLIQDDTVHLLPEGLSMEAEKILCSLICFTNDHRIRMSFIEACIDNVAHHRSVLVSLRMLPKLFGSFPVFTRATLDTYQVTMWAEKELNMMQYFFKDLVYYVEVLQNRERSHYIYTHRDEIQVRLHFLAYVFSAVGSPDAFRLTLEQVDTLWSCLATDEECSDDCLSWFLNQAKSKDHHAMGLETFKHLFMEKMPQLRPESMTMTGLNLFQQLCHLARIANSSMDNALPEDKISGMNQLWGIALRAQNTDVSMNAVQFINNYYINYGSGSLEKEEEFVNKCMDYLVNASKNISIDPECELMVIQRGLILLKNHLESFRQRYAFHMRNWLLDGMGVFSHQKGVKDKQSTPIRVVLQPAGHAEKITIEMMSTDQIADLRAEVTRWWSALQKQEQKIKKQQAAGTTSMLTPILGSMLGDGPIRMITLGQELSFDVDEKTLSEMQFKDQQLLFVSVGASRTPRKHDGSTPTSFLPAPDRDQIPMMLLQKSPHFEQLFNLLQQLASLNCDDSMDSQELCSIQNKARLLSRRVWELLMLLPTNTDILLGFKSIINNETEKASKEKQRVGVVDWDSLLSTQSSHKLMYSLQIVESLSRPLKNRRRSMMRSGGGDSYLSTDSEMSVDCETAEEIWSKQFITQGGLKHLFNIFTSGVLQVKDGDNWNQWSQECLAYLLRLVSQFAVLQSDGEDDVFETFESPRKKMKRHKASEKMNIQTLNQAILSMINTDTVLKILMTILYDATLPADPSQVHSGSWGRTEVVHYALSFLVSWAYSCDKVLPALCSCDNFPQWLKRLTLEAPEPYMRLEACRGIYRLCLGRSDDGKLGYNFLMPVLASLLSFLSKTLKMKPRKRDYDDKDKELYGAGSRDYFWLLCRLIDGICHNDAEKSWQEEESTVDLDWLASHTMGLILDREYKETKQLEDDGLIGLLNVTSAVMKHNPPVKFQERGQSFTLEVFWMLFALPTQEKRHLPKCKSHTARSAAYDLLVEMVKSSLNNYAVFHEKMLAQHMKDGHSPYTWDHWPHEDGRSTCGYVGLTNLGATCYMATCMQHLYMIPQARKFVLEAKCSQNTKHEGTLTELQKMFAYLLESERKAYNPRSFCKVYTMDKLPLNTGEQKDMTEFFTDLITKLEEMSPELRKLVKNLFGGVITNNVVSLDCPHVSRTKEEFYTVRCQVTDMKNLYESLDEVTVKDTLEGDNMYTCSKCQKKVRAEKRACFKRLPKILCFNTMRYTFNMLTMMKEKVNTHFSFPLRLDMSGYLEKNLLEASKLSDDDEEEANKQEAEEFGENIEVYSYELIGVTVHTGTADGGHYYSFIRDRLNKNETGQDKWYLFNDAEVKPFDPSQLAYECFGGEMTSKTYDSVTDKFMDFSFEKTNSAYMLFYERRKQTDEESEPQCEQTENEAATDTYRGQVNLSKELAEWIWQDNTQFLQDKNIFERTYFEFMWQMCSYIPTTLIKEDPVTVPLLAAKLGTSFVLETLIHSKEKPLMVSWIELISNKFNSCHAACEWFLDHMASDDWWPVQILIKCPNLVVRQMFQRLLIHVITQLRAEHHNLYLSLHAMESDGEECELAELGSQSCVTRFIKKMLTIIENVKPSSKHLTEYFAFMLDFAKMGSNECIFLIHISAISTFINFYMGHKPADYNHAEATSEDDEDEDDDVIPLSDEKYRPQALEKMITLIAMLVENARGEDNKLELPEDDLQALIDRNYTQINYPNMTDKEFFNSLGNTMKLEFPFLFSQIRDCINVRQTCNLIFSLSRWNDRLAYAIVNMMFNSITKLNSDQAQPFFKLLSCLVEFVGGPPGMPPFTQFILRKFWELTEFCPQQCLEWLSNQVTRNKLVHNWVLKHMNVWVEQYLMANSNIRVRNAAGHLLVSLVPCNHFRQVYRSTRSLPSPHKDMHMSPEALIILHEIYKHLLNLLPNAKLYVDTACHGTMKLMPYFLLMMYCLVSKTEKLMFSCHFQDLWTLFQPKLSEPPISTHQNKQALLLFWYQVCVDCPENVKLIVTNAHVTKNIAFNYILADHEDQDVVMFNRCMLPAYYGILRMCCAQSRTFTRQLSQHQNIQWAFKNILPYSMNYTAAVDELFKIMRIMVTKHQDASDEELRSIAAFRSNTIRLFMQNIDSRAWQTIIQALKIVVESLEDRLLVIYQQGFTLLSDCFQTLHSMYHEATACHVIQEILDLLHIIIPILKVGKLYQEKKMADVRTCLVGWKGRMDFVRRLLTLLNTYTPPEIRIATSDVLREMIIIYPNDALNHLVPILLSSHMTFQEQGICPPMGPYFPKRGQKPISSKASIRPPRPQFQMFLHHNQLESNKGVDEQYDQALWDFYTPYYLVVDLLVRMAVNQRNLNDDVINLSAMVAYEGVPLHVPYFGKLWYEIYHSEQVDKKCIQHLCASNALVEYVDAVLLDERLSLSDSHIYQFFCNFFPKVYQQVLNDQGKALMESIVASVVAERAALDNVRSDRDFNNIAQRINGDVRAMLLIFSVQPPKSFGGILKQNLQSILKICQKYQQAKRAREEQERKREEQERKLEEQERKKLEEEREKLERKKIEIEQEIEAETRKKRGSVDSKLPETGGGSAKKRRRTTSTEHHIQGDKSETIEDKNPTDKPMDTTSDIPSSTTDDSNVPSDKPGHSSEKSGQSEKPGLRDKSGLGDKSGLSDKPNVTNDKPRLSNEMQESTSDKPTLSSDKDIPCDKSLPGDKANLPSSSKDVPSCSTDNSNDSSSKDTSEDQKSSDNDSKPVTQDPKTKTMKKSSEKPSTSTRAYEKPGPLSKKLARNPRERPGPVDMCIRNIDNLFGMINKGRDSSEETEDQ